MTKAWKGGSVPCRFSSKASGILSRHRAVMSRRPKIIAGQNGVSTGPDMEEIMRKEVFKPTSIGELHDRWLASSGFDQLLQHEPIHPG